MGILCMVMGILFILFTYLAIMLIGGLNQYFIGSGLIIAILPVIFLFIGINANKQKKQCAVAGIVLNAIPSVIYMLAFIGTFIMWIFD